MFRKLLLHTFITVAFFSCATGSRSVKNDEQKSTTTDRFLVQPELVVAGAPLPLTDLPQSEDGGFVLSPGFYEAEFKTYCLQPGTPDPSPRDAYLQTTLKGRHSDIIQTILVNSRKNSHLEQRNIQLLLWSVVSESDYSKLPRSVQSTAMQLLSPKQIFELKGGVAGIVRSYSSMLPGYSSTTVHKNMQRLFDVSSSSYEFFERVAVLQQPSFISKPDYRKDQWVSQGNYYVRYFPASYQKVTIQVYVPQDKFDGNKIDGAYVVFDPTGLLAVPANSNAQRLGIGAPVISIIKSIIKIEQRKADDRRKSSDPKPVKGVS